MVCKECNRVIDIEVDTTSRELTRRKKEAQEIVRSHHYFHIALLVPARLPRGIKEVYVERVGEVVEIQALCDDDEFFLIAEVASSGLTTELKCEGTAGGYLEISPAEKLPMHASQRGIKHICACVSLQYPPDDIIESLPETDSPIWYDTEKQLFYERHYAQSAAKADNEQ
jgi:hypothetical protein